MSLNRSVSAVPTLPFRFSVACVTGLTVLDMFLTAGEVSEALMRMSWLARYWVSDQGFRELAFVGALCCMNRSVLRWVSEQGFAFSTVGLRSVILSLHSTPVVLVYVRLLSRHFVKQA